MKRLILLFIILFCAGLLMGHGVPPTPHNAVRIKGKVVQDTTGNLADNDIMKWDLASGEWQYVAEAGASGTADSMGVDTDGDGTVDAYLYSTVAGAFHIKKGSNITLTVLEDTLTIASTGGGSDTSLFLADVIDGFDVIKWFSDTILFYEGASAAAGDTLLKLFLTPTNDTTVFDREGSVTHFFFTPQLIFGDIVEFRDAIHLEGLTVDGFEQIITTADITGSDKTFTFPNDELADLDFLVGTGAGTFGYVPLTKDITVTNAGVVTIDTTASTVTTYVENAIFDTLAPVHTLIGQLVDDSTSWNDASDSTLAWDNRGYPDATTTLQGIASFSSTNFAVGTGVVTIKSGGVDLTDEVTGILPDANIPDHTGDVSGGTVLTNVTQRIINDDIDTTAENFAFDGAYHITTADADSAYASLEFVRVEIEDSLNKYLPLVDITDLPAAGNWKVFYSNGSAVITELTLGGDGTVLKSNGATSAPTWETDNTGGAADTSLVLAEVTDGADVVRWSNADTLLVYESGDTLLKLWIAGDGTGDTTLFDAEGQFTHFYFVKQIVMGDIVEFRNDIHIEGTTVDAFEHIITVVDPTVSDKTFTFPNDQIADLDLIIGTGAGTFGYVAMGTDGALSNAGALTINDDAIQESDLEITNAGSAGNVLSKGAGDDFTWIAAGSGSSSWDSSIIKIDTLNFQIADGFDTTIQILHDTTGHATGNDSVHFQAPDGALLFHGQADDVDTTGTKITAMVDNRITDSLDIYSITTGILLRDGSQSLSGNLTVDDVDITGIEALEVDTIRNAAGIFVANNFNMLDNALTNASKVRTDSLYANNRLFIVGHTGSGIQIYSNLIAAGLRWNLDDNRLVGSPDAVIVIDTIASDAAGQPIVIGLADTLRPDVTSQISLGHANFTFKTLYLDSLDASNYTDNSIEDNDINWGTSATQVDIEDVPSANTWSTVYWNATVPVTLDLGASGDVLTSGGVAAAPTWETPSGGGGNTFKLFVDSGDGSQAAIALSDTVALQGTATVGIGFNNQDIDTLIFRVNLGSLDSTHLGVNSIGVSELDLGTGAQQVGIEDMNSSDDWSTVYWNATVPVTLPLGASGLVLKSNGTASAPTWQADNSGSGPWAVGGIAAGVDTTAIQVDANDDTTAVITDDDAGAVTWDIGADQSSLTIGSAGITTIDSADVILLKFDDFILYAGGNRFGAYDSTDEPSDGDVLTYNTGTDVIDWQPDASGSSTMADIFPFFRRALFDSTSSGVPDSIFIVDASVTVKGVASFDATDFSDASGVITIDNDGHLHTTSSISGLLNVDIGAGAAIQATKLADDEIDEEELNNTIDFSSEPTSVTFNAGEISYSEMTFSNNIDSADLGANSVGESELDLGSGSQQVGIEDMISSDDWSTIYFGASGAFVSLPLGSSGLVLKSNGTASAPTWQSDIGAPPTLEETFEFMRRSHFDTTTAETIDTLFIVDDGHAHTTSSISGLLDADMANDAMSPDKLLLDVSDDGFVDVVAGGTGLGTMTVGGLLFGNGTSDLIIGAVIADGFTILGDGTTFPTTAQLVVSSASVLLRHEVGGMELDVSAFADGLYGVASSATLNVDTEAEFEAAIAGIDFVTIVTDDVTSANMITAVSDETGSGLLVFATSPVFLTNITLPVADNPTTGTDAMIAFDGNDNALEMSDGTVDFFIATKLKLFSMTIDNPDGLTNDTLIIIPVEAEAFPFGITLVDLGIKTWAATTYSVSFAEYSLPGNAGRTELIETLATSGSREAEDDGTLNGPSVPAGSFLMIELPATDIAQLTVWGTYYVNTGD